MQTMSLTATCATSSCNAVPWHGSWITSDILQLNAEIDMPYAVLMYKHAYECLIKRFMMPFPDTKPQILKLLVVAKLNEIRLN